MILFFTWASCHVLLCPFVLSKTCENLQHFTMDILKRLLGNLHEHLKWVRRHCIEKQPCDLREIIRGKLSRIKNGCQCFKRTALHVSFRGFDIGTQDFHDLIITGLVIKYHSQTKLRMCHSTNCLYCNEPEGGVISRQEGENILQKCRILLSHLCWSGLCQVTKESNDAYKKQQESKYVINDLDKR